MVKKFLASLALVAAVLLPSTARADIPPANYGVISAAATAVVIKGLPGTLFAIVSNGTQTTVLTCYDNATAASGTVLYSGTPTAGQLIQFGPAGNAVTNGITCEIATSIVGTINVLYR